MSEIFQGSLAMRFHRIHRHASITIEKKFCISESIIESTKGEGLRTITATENRFRRTEVRKNSNKVGGVSAMYPLEVHITSDS